MFCRPEIKSKNICSSCKWWLTPVTVNDGGQDEHSQDLFNLCDIFKYSIQLHLVQYCRGSQFVHNWISCLHYVQFPYWLLKKCIYSQNLGPVGSQFVGAVVSDLKNKILHHMWCPGDNIKQESHSRATIMLHGPSPLHQNMSLSCWQIAFELFVQILL